jgi:hypothetical protein
MLGGGFAISLYKRESVQPLELHANQIGYVATSKISPGVKLVRAD